MPRGGAGACDSSSHQPRQCGHCGGGRWEVHSPGRETSPACHGGPCGGGAAPPELGLPSWTASPAWLRVLGFVVPASPDGGGLLAEGRLTPVRRLSPPPISLFYLSAALPVKCQLEKEKVALMLSLSSVTRFG